MPTAQLVYDDHQAHYAIERMHIETAGAMEVLQQQIETVLRIELAKLAPQDRRLFRAELAEIRSSVNHDTKAGTWTLVLEADPPRTWLVERGSDDDTMSDENAAMLIKAGAGSCRFDSDGDGDCAVALCDFHYPEAWV
jgi:hypothetical protein